MLLEVTQLECRGNDAEKQKRERVREQGKATITTMTDVEELASTIRSLL